MPPTRTNAARWHAVTAAVAASAVVFQLVLVVQGGTVLDETDPPDLVTRVYRFFSYFTIQSNLLVAVTAAWLARTPTYDGRAFRVLRAAGLVGITITGVVHFVLLRPLLDLTGADWAADKLLHMVVPALAVAAWAVVGPRPRIAPDGWGLVGRVLVWPLGWLAWTLVVGGLSGWYPYPFLDHREDGAAAVVVASVGITVAFLVFFALAALVDGRAAATPRETLDRTARPDRTG